MKENPFLQDPENQDDLLANVLASVEKQGALAKSESVSEEEISHVENQFKNSKFSKIIDAIKSREENPGDKKEGRYKILLVDDSMIFRRKMMDMLDKHYDIMVDEASNVFEAAALISIVDAYDFMFLDHNMPGRSGLTLLEEIKGHKYKPKHIVYVTTETEHAVVTKSILLGVSHYLTKPFKEEKLIGVVNKLLHNQK